ncbi:MAG: bifunctional demethylmenaquinone methyltransferase/2-methoxy-6-polyprenyl-1,4-benzoquinol methylase UbiE [Robiginitomaculum sp.]|nr:MAG: bifunctional demethylmenaquinone methyltransferase/2-methoxy-6-polyprenyl-1,4-benzoquinol methylase UbiE [Robiginitomaculum sp.]
MTEQNTKQDTIDFGFEDIPVSEKQAKVRSVFDSVASKYDLMNDAMSVGLHRVWKDMTINKINPQPGELHIDVAGGTGDLARRFIKKAEQARLRRYGKWGGKPARAIIADINAEMLLAGIDEQKDAGLDITRVCGNAQSLPFPDNFADVITIAFGIRNVTDRMQALQDMRRVLKPGGRFFCLEFSTPPTEWLRQFYDLYSFNVIPPMGEVLTGDRDSYQYLVESIRKFPKGAEFAAMIKDAGYARVGFENYTGGVCALHWGWKV